MSVVVIEAFDLLDDYVQAWEDLAIDALEPNPFYEWWMLLPALRGLSARSDLRVVLILKLENGRPVLCGVFPLERKRRYKGFPISAFTLWKHCYCGLCTPLIRNDDARDCLRTFLDWLASESCGALMEFNLVSGRGAFHELLNECLRERGSSSFICESFSRAVLRPIETAEQYERAGTSTRQRQEMRRKLRRLSEIGPVEWDALEPDGDVDKWIDEFLQLEMSGWKGKEGSALSCVEAGRNYFVAIARDAFRKGKLMMSGIRLNTEPLALRCCLIAGGGAFVFKSAYDENYARFSPGILLEIENIRRLHGKRDIGWMDSCAAPVHFSNHLWHERREIQSVLVSTGRLPGDLLVSLMPLMRRINRGLRSRTKND